MDPIALYYPYIHVRDDTWLKYAALYWPKLGRLVPADYPIRDSATARTLRRELGWLIDVDPEPAVHAVQRPFLQLLNDHERDLRRRFQLRNVDAWPVRPAYRFDNVGQASPERATSADSGSGLDRRLSYIHVSEMDPSLIDSVRASGIARLVAGRGGNWIGVHPDLANIYMCALTEQAAASNHLHPVTDQLLPHAAASGWNVERIAEALLGERFSGVSRPGPGDPLDTFVLMAFETVVPDDLAGVSVDKIVEIRTKFGADLDRLRSYVTAQVDQLAGIADVQDATVFQEYIRDEVQKTVAQELAELRERLRSVGLESVRAIANIKRVALPPLLAESAHLVGVDPAVGGSVAVAACLATIPVQAHKQAKATVKESPVGYLFRVGQAINPPSLLAQVRGLMRGMI